MKHAILQALFVAGFVTAGYFFINKFTSPSLLMAAFSGSFLGCFTYNLYQLRKRENNK